MDLINNTKNTLPYTNIVVAKGDGIGPDIMDVAISVLKEAGAKLKFEFVEIGEKYYEKGYSAGISDEAWEAIRHNRIFLKGPITTPQGGGYSSINVTLRKALGLYANVRPCHSYYPFVETKHPAIDMVIIRENEEDLYAGIEYQQSADCVHGIKVITRLGCERIIKYAFEYAKKNNRKKVTCMTKDNIMKQCDGLFHKVFDEIKLQYPEITADHYIIDIGSARLATKPEIFDVVVTLNLYGDIVSDVVAEMTGSVGLAGSSNIGERYAMFEAIHGSAPTLVGQNAANPSSLINASIMMLAHIGQGTIAKKIQDALLYTIESGVNTRDICRKSTCNLTVGTKEFGEEVIKNLGKKPEKLKSQDFPDFDFDYKPDDVMLGIAPPLKYENAKQIDKKLVGVDIFIDLPCNGEEIGAKLEECLKNSGFDLKLISSRGIKIYPSPEAKYTLSDSWRCRIVKKDPWKNDDIIKLLTICKPLDIVKTENLYDIDGKRVYSVAQGE